MSNKAAPVCASLNEYIAESVRNNWDRPALTDFSGATYHYRDVARKIAKLHLLYEGIGLKPGDRIALCGRNSAGWAVAWLSIVTYGAVAVPIQHEYKADNIHSLLNHSGSQLLFTAGSIWENLDPEQIPDIKGALRINDFSLLYSACDKLPSVRAHLNALYGERYPDRFTAADFTCYEPDPDDMAILNYTSGSTGFSKGVMLSFRCMWSNVQYIRDKMSIIQPGDAMVCMLPMSHMYGMLVDFIYGISAGAHLHFLTRSPSPRVIIDAFARVRPKLIVSVPLILEKIIKTRVFPLLEKPYMKLLMHVPFVDERLRRRIMDKLKETFGGNLEEIIIGGAPLNKDVELFLRRIGFPYTVGYGMTECGPMITYERHERARAQSCGRVADRMTMRVDSPDPLRIPGELWVKGDNVMLGYYRNEEATAAVMRDGWFNTEDVCTIDADGFLYIRGRSKNMILGPNGQNIYPEEIEDKLNNMPYVGESLIVSENGKLVALVHPDFPTAEREGLGIEAITAIMDDNLSQLNSELPSFSQLSRFKLFDEEFEKTPKKSIKRYLYQHN